VAHRIRPVPTIELQDVALRIEREDWLDPARHVAGKQADGPSGSNREQMAVAYAMRRNCSPYLLGQPRDEPALEIGAALESRESAALTRQIDRCLVGGAAHRALHVACDTA